MNDIYNTIGGGNPMNWAQQRPLPTQAETMGTLLEALRAQSQAQFAHSPFGGSFNRRFGGNSFSPIQNELDAPSAKTGQELGPAEQARLISALQTAASEAGQFSPTMTTRRMTSGTYRGPGIGMSERENALGFSGIAPHGGPMQSQPWYDEYVEAAQGGADLPMVLGPGGSPIDQKKQAAYLGERKKDMDSRKLKVQNKAAAKGDQRGLRMGNLSPMEAGMSVFERSGDGDQFNRDAMQWGPGVALGREQNAIDFQQLQSSLEAGGTQLQRFVGGIMAQAAANGQDVTSLLPRLLGIGRSLGMQGAEGVPAVAEMPPVPPSPEQMQSAYENSNGDPAAFARIVESLGGSREQANNFVTQQTGAPATGRFQRAGLLDWTKNYIGADGSAIADLFTRLNPAPAQLPERLRQQYQNQLPVR